jgi:hypothetical protein
LRLKSVGEEFLQEESIKGGSARLSNADQSNTTLTHEGNESVVAKTLAQDDRFIRAVAKRVKELSSRQRKSA